MKKIDKIMENEIFDCPGCMAKAKATRIIVTITKMTKEEREKRFKELNDIENKTDENIMEISYLEEQLI